MAHPLWTVISASPVPQIWNLLLLLLPLDLAKAPAREPQPYTGLGYHCHRSSLAIITHFCLRNINHPLAASQAYVRVIKGLPSLTQLFCLTVRIALQGNTQEPTQQVFLTARLEWAGPRSPGLGGPALLPANVPSDLGEGGFLILLSEPAAWAGLA